MGVRTETWNDVTDHFEFVEDKLVYVDAPLEGILRSKTGELFAFRCAPIVLGCLWHWVLLRVNSVEDSVADAFERAGKVSPEGWVSIVEDRRGDHPHLFVAWLTRGIHKIPDFCTTSGQS